MSDKIKANDYSEMAFVSNVDFLLILYKSGFRCCSFQGGGSVVVDSLWIVTPIVGFCNCSIFCCVLICVHSSFATISIGKRDLVALLCLSSWCLMIVVWLFHTMPWVCLQFVIVVFPDHTRLLFLTDPFAKVFYSLLILLYNYNTRSYNFIQQGR